MLIHEVVFDEMLELQRRSPLADLILYIFN